MIMTEPIFNDFARERNLKPGSINVYKNALKHYTEFNAMTLTELLKEAEKQEDEKIPWRKRTLLNRLVDFRNYIIDQGYTSTKMVDRVITFYKHHYIEIHQLPKTNHLLLTLLTNQLPNANYQLLTNQLPTTNYQQTNDQQKEKQSEKQMKGKRKWQGMK